MNLNQWNTIGNYLGREISIAKYDPLNCLIVEKSLQDSLLLVVTNQDGETKAERKEILSMVISGMPLGIDFCGQDAKVLFDMLIEKVSERDDGVHFMTKFFNSGGLDDALEDFLIATWPSEERFDMWKKYRILCIGESLISKVEEYIELNYP